MAFLSRFRTQILSWWQDAPLPAGAPAVFQSWHEFDERSSRWRAVDMGREIAASSDDRGTSSQDATEGSYNLVTWNVDYSSPLPGQRLSAILSRILALSPTVDIVFFQEVSGEAFLVLLDEPEIRRSWFLSDADGVLPAGQSFKTVTLLSKTRFQSPKLGPVSRVKYPSRFDRDALCCDIFVPHAAGRPDLARLRLINVHLDSLPIQPCLRPQQISIAAALLRSAGRGVVAGDFNPVLPADDSLVQENGLVDAWVELRPSDPGFTWGADGKEPFPPKRMDKIASLGLRVQHIEVLMPGCISKSDSGGQANDDDRIAWSDHAGLRCSFKMVRPY
ncbi:Endonuclease/exonuclease/phosphatase [Achaetomium macrosporum]|uniref:Endonuclease/exonuclease/phosphatase n=1 Tax=Achaetomium macrosporum TaxID=79813 RepID=A0AAN7CA93_9PEZI|nr:Endonuclease/exonuclease/phosphatase [Achaetomium macrosporum]